MVIRRTIHPLSSSIKFEISGIATSQIITPTKPKISLESNENHLKNSPKTIKIDKGAFKAREITNPGW